MQKLLYLIGGVGFALFFSGWYTARRQQRPGFALIDESTLLDLNHATQEEIEALEGIDPVLAELIIENRPYLSKIDLIERRIIPDAAYEGIKHSIRAHHPLQETGAA